MTTLESDTPNADTQLHPEFYIFQGEGQFKGVPHIRIFTPGDKCNVPDRPVTDFDKRRFPREWLAFQMAQSGEQIIGTPLNHWRLERPDELSDNQLSELLILKFQSVEQLAQASDAQIQRIGLGAAGLRERARLYLAGKNVQAGSAIVENQNAKIAALEEMVRQLTANQVAPKKKGRPRGKPFAKKSAPDQRALNEVPDDQNSPATGAASL